MLLRDIFELYESGLTLIIDPSFSSKMSSQTNSSFNIRKGYFVLFCIDFVDRKFLPKSSKKYSRNHVNILISIQNLPHNFAESYGNKTV